MKGDIKFHVKETRFEVVDWMQLALDGPISSSSEYSNVYTGYRKETRLA
jgi:hypothetical protein